MVYKIIGGIGLILLGASMAGFTPITLTVVGIILIVAGIALLAGY